MDRATRDLLVHCRLEQYLDEFVFNKVDWSSLESMIHHDRDALKRLGVSQQHCSVLADAVIARAKPSEAPSGRSKHVNRRERGAVCSVSGRGYGFIATENGDIYFHTSALRDPGAKQQIAVGCTVEFSVGRDPKDGRYQAEDVAILSSKKEASERDQPRHYDRDPRDSHEARRPPPPQHYPSNDRHAEESQHSEDSYSDDSESGEENEEDGDRPRGSRRRVKAQTYEDEEEDRQKGRSGERPRDNQRCDNDRGSTGRIRGTVCSLSAKGFGFLRTAAHGDVYFHSSSMLKAGTFDTLRNGDAILFSIIDQDGKTRAVNAVLEEHEHEYPSRPRRGHRSRRSREEREERRRNREREREFNRGSRDDEGDHRKPRHRKLADHHQETPTGPSRIRGKIISLSGKGFGFIKTTEGDVYIHSTGMLKAGTFDSLRVGTPVEFTLSTDGKMRAEDVVILEKVRDRDFDRDVYRRDVGPPRLFGVIYSVSRRGYGFIRTPDGDIYFHSTSIEPPANFDMLRPGMQVEFTVNREGKMHADKVVVMAALLSQSADQPPSPRHDDEEGEPEHDVEREERLHSQPSEDEMYQGGIGRDDKRRSRAAPPKEEAKRDEAIMEEPRRRRDRDPDPSHSDEKERLERKEEKVQEEDPDEVISGRMTGVVISLSDQGDGFLSTPQGGEVYLHISGMRDREAFDGLHQGMRVDFQLMRDKRDGSVRADDVFVVDQSGVGDSGGAYGFVGVDDEAD